MAGLESCPTCGNKTSENAALCPGCGEPLSPGWAHRIRLEKEEQAEREKQAVIREAQAAKRAKWKRVAFAAVMCFVFASFAANAILEDRGTDDPKGNGPAEFQRKVKRLEDLALRIPEVEFDEKIAVYQRLQQLDPGKSAEYAGKIALYEIKRIEYQEGRNGR